VKVLNLSTKERNKLITYYKTYGVTSLKKHVDANLVVIVKKIEEEANGPIKGTLKRQLVKSLFVLGCAISMFFTINNPFKKDDE
jgi:hypothetical protein